MLKRSVAIERAYEDFQKGILRRTGVMVHHVTEIVDRGSPIVVEEINIGPEDKLEDLQVSRFGTCQILL